MLQQQHKQECCSNVFGNLSTGDPPLPSHQSLMKTELILQIRLRSTF